MKQFGVSLLILSVLSWSCSHPKWISKKKPTRVTQGYMSTYKNQALGFEINLFALAYNIYRLEYDSQIPSCVKKAIKKECNKGKKKIVFVASDTSLSPNEFYYVGLLGNAQSGPDYTMHTAKSGSNYKMGNFFSIQNKIDFGKVIVQLENADLSILCFNLKNPKRKSIAEYSLPFFKEVINSLFFNHLKTSKDSSQINQPSFFDFFNIIAKRAQGNYLSIIKQLTDAKKGYPDSSDQYFLYEFLATQYSILDNLEEVKNMIKRQDSITISGRRGGRKVSPYIYSLDWKLAKSIILEKARACPVIMFNESHFDWRHRYFVMILLDSLHKLGYRRLALEALSPADDSLNLRGYALQKSGVYTSEPSLGNLIRMARKKGFTVLPYEDTISSSNREFTQAKNLYEGYVKDTTGMIVLAGYGHIIEDTAKTNLSMAAYFKKMLGKDILTIDQTQYDDLFYETSFFPEKEKNYYASLESKGSSGDITIINNLRSQPFEILNKKEGHEIYSIKIPLKKYTLKSNPVFLFIYLEKEFNIYNDRCVPVLCRKINRDEKKVRVQLYKDEYIGLLRNKDGAIISSFSLSKVY